MKSTRSIRSRLQESHKNLDLLEAIDAFEQIRSLVVGSSEKRPCLAREALLELYQLILRLIQTEAIEGFNDDKIWRLLGVIEEDISRVSKNAEKILNTISKLHHVFSDDWEGPENTPKNN